MGEFLGSYEMSFTIGTNSKYWETLRIQPVIKFYLPESWACANSNTWAFHAQNLPMVETVSLQDKNS